MPQILERELLERRIEMTESTLTPVDTTINKEYGYSISYDSEVTKRFIASRTAEIHASFFLPHLRAGMTVLDCGCGPGGITVGLAEAVAPGEVVGIDLAESQLEQARAHARKQEVSNIRFDVANVYELPYPDNTFDAVFAHHVFIHLAHPMEALKEMHRVLKPGGVSAVREIGFGGWMMYSPKYEDFMRQFNSIWEQYGRTTSGGEVTIGRRLRALFNQAGFKDVRASASYESWGTPEGVKWISGILANACMDQKFIEGVTSGGIADHKTIDRIRDAFIDMENDEDALIAMSQGEALGWKELLPVNDSIKSARR